MWSGIWTTALLIIFLGIVGWAFSRKRRRAFDEAARLPLENDDRPLPPASDNKGEPK